MRSPVTRSIRRAVRDISRRTCSRLATMAGVTCTQIVAMSSPAIANPSDRPATVPPLPSGTTTRAGMRQLSRADLFRKLQRRIDVRENAERCGSAKRHVTALLSESSQLRGEQRSRRAAIHARRHAFIGDHVGNAVRRVIHVMSPSYADYASAKSACVHRGGQHVRGSLTAGRDDGVAAADTGQQELERASLVAAADRGVEAVRFDPYLGAVDSDTIDRRRQHAQ